LPSADLHLKNPGGSGNILFFKHLFSYNRSRSRKSHDSAIDVVPEVFGAESA
jgi:hypothetical protein